MQNIKKKKFNKFLNFIIILYIEEILKYNKKQPEERTTPPHHLFSPESELSSESESSNSFWISLRA